MGGRSPGLPWLIAAGEGEKGGALALARPPASLSRVAAAAAAERQRQSCSRGPAWCRARRGGEQAVRPGPRCQGAGPGAGLPAPGRPSSSAHAAAPAAPLAIVTQRPDALQPAGCYRGLWPARHSSLKIWPPPPCRPPARSGFGAARWTQDGGRPPTGFARVGHPASADLGGALGRKGTEGHRARRPAVRSRGRVPLSPPPPLHAGRPPSLPVPRYAVAPGLKALKPSGGRGVPHLSACASAGQCRLLWCEYVHLPGTNPLGGFITRTRQGRGGVVGTGKSGVTPDVALLFLMASPFCACLSPCFHCA